MYFSFYNILPIVWVCLGVAVLAVLWLLIIYRSATKIRLTPSEVEEPQDGAENALPDDLPTVSVIVYANDNAAELRRSLPELLAQEYPQDKMEVIVVNDGSVEDITDVVNYLSQEHHKLYLTFVPEEARNLSRKKLSVSLGVKAARNEVVVLTTAECRPVSKRWLLDMSTPFTAAGGSKDVALGRVAITGIHSPGLRFSQAAITATWLKAAMRRRPYRGTGFNLAYRRRLFFEVKGFSRSLNLHNGDDDIFVNQIVTRDNTAVVLTRDSLMRASFQRADHVFRDIRLAHSFTARFLPKGARRLMGISTAMMWLWVAATAAGCVFSLPNYFPACIFAALIPILWIPLTVNWLRTGRALGLKLSAPLLWWEMLWRWISTLSCRLKCNSAKRRNYTWHHV